MAESNGRSLPVAYAVNRPVWICSVTNCGDRRSVAVDWRDSNGLHNRDTIDRCWIVGDRCNRSIAIHWSGIAVHRRRIGNTIHWCNATVAVVVVIEQMCGSTATGRDCNKQD